LPWLFLARCAIYWNKTRQLPQYFVWVAPVRGFAGLSGVQSTLGSFGRRKIWVWRYTEAPSFAGPGHHRVAIRRKWSLDIFFTGITLLCNRTASHIFLKLGEQSPVEPWNQTCAGLRKWFETHCSVLYNNLLWNIFVGSSNIRL
jgi:hypothetical protein